MRYDLAAIRELVSAAFSDEELRTFCFDHFRAVYEQFAAGQSKGAWVLALVEHADTHGLLDNLLAQVKTANPPQAGDRPAITAPGKAQGGLMPAPIALQLYSIRDLLAADYAAGVRKVAAIGYAGVETAGFPGTTPQAAARLFGELGLTVCSAHSPLPLGDKQAEVLDTMAALGCTRLVCPWKLQELFASIDGIRQVCDELNEANIVARAHGLTLSYHNHWAECALVGGHRAYEIMFAHLSPEILFEVDTYWAKTAGVDPVTLVRQLGTRAPLLHIKDGPCVMDAPMTAVGDGVQDVPEIVAAGAGATEWLIVELDRCATDMLEAVAKSYRYMVGKGLAHGK